MLLRPVGDIATSGIHVPATVAMSDIYESLSMLLMSRPQAYCHEICCPRQRSAHIDICWQHDQRKCCICVTVQHAVLRMLQT